ncbi:hypothetical protein TIFTF001_042491 [Ficus carica]|uniref:K Homology domain-containing protein n=1 Tax=Ficus carica TaxID=3494 RepID=A0AA87ZGZ5_FICCA|nr:hypothetical protein TIFTF001_042491 [Ficus carica]
MQIQLPCADAIIGTSGATVSYIRHASGATVSIQETWVLLPQNCMANAAAGSAQAQPAAPTALGYDSYAAHGCVYASLNNAGHARPMAETVEQTSDTKCSTFWFMDPSTLWSHISVARDSEQISVWPEIVSKKWVERLIAEEYRVDAEVERRISEEKRK